MLSLILLMACSRTPASRGRTAADPDARSPDEIVARWEGGSLRWSDVASTTDSDLALLRAQYLVDRHGKERGAVNRRIADRLIVLEAAARGVEPKALLSSEVDARAEPPTEAGIAARYELKKAHLDLGGRTLEDLHAKIAEDLVREAREARFAAFVDELRDRYHVATSLSVRASPSIPVSTDDDPVRGPPDAPVTIVAFVDYQCSYCRQARPIVDDLVGSESDVRLVQRDFPLDMHPRALETAIAVNCADSQGRFWEMAARVFEHQSALEDADLRADASALGLDLEVWDRCRIDPTVRAEIDADIQDGERAGVRGTPAYFVNGQLFEDAPTAAELRDLVQTARSSL
jgi:protein-disulfide isomerase